MRATTSEPSRPTAVRRADGSLVELTIEQARLVELTIDEQKLLSPRDAAHLLGVSRPMVIRWINEGLLEDRRTGAHHKIPIASVNALKLERAAAGRAAVTAVRAAEDDPAAARTTAAARERAKARIARRENAS